MTLSTPTIRRSGKPNRTGRRAPPSDVCQSASKCVKTDRHDGFRIVLVCTRDYGGDWGKQGFTGYMQGFEVALGDWRLLLNALDRLREQRRMAIICLCHTRVATFKNPQGADFDRYAPALHAKTWELTHRWADHVLFANFYMTVERDGPRPKAFGGQERILYTTRHAAYDAKNRAGLPDEIEMGTSGEDAWQNFLTAIKAAKNGHGHSSSILNPNQQPGDPS